MDFQNPDTLKLEQSIYLDKNNKVFNNAVFYYDQWSDLYAVVYNNKVIQLAIEGVEEFGDSDQKTEFFKRYREREFNSSTRIYDL